MDIPPQHSGLHDDLAPPLIPQHDGMWKIWGDRVYELRYVDMGEIKDWTWWPLGDRPL